MSMSAGVCVCVRCNELCVLVCVCVSSFWADQTRSLFLRRLKSLAERHSQLCSSRSTQKPSTFLEKSLSAGLTDSRGEDEESEARRGVKIGRAHV